MAIEYAKLFHSKARQNLPKLVFLVWNYLATLVYVHKSKIQTNLLLCQSSFFVFFMIRNFYNFTLLRQSFLVCFPKIFPKSYHGHVNIVEHKVKLALPGSQKTMASSSASRIDLEAWKSRPPTIKKHTGAVVS
jgi:hypothetical protein